MFNYQWAVQANLNPLSSKFKSCLKQIQNVRPVHVLGTPHMENCSKYSASTIHTCMKVEPPIHGTASKVHFCLPRNAAKFSTNLNQVYFF